MPLTSTANCIITNFCTCSWIVLMPTIFRFNKTEQRLTYHLFGRKDRDLTPLDYFLCEFLKTKMYTNALQIIQELKHNIRLEIAAIDSMILQKSLKITYFSLSWKNSASGAPFINIFINHSTLIQSFCYNDENGNTFKLVFLFEIIFKIVRFTWFYNSMTCICLI